MAELFTTSLYTDPNLIAYYRFENVNDSKGTFTLTNNGVTPFNPAKYNNGADFGTANTTKYLQTTAQTSLDGGSCTFAGWVKINTEITSGVYHLFEQANGTSQTLYRVRYEYNGGTIRLVYSRGKAGVADQVANYTTTLGIVTQHHVGLTYNGTSVIGYLDGASVGTVAASGTGMAAPTAGLTFGANNDAANLGNETLDDWAIFTRALTAAEISSLYNDSVASLLNTMEI